MAKLVINAWNKKFKINKDLYGQFSEHIGRGIYEGIYVGEDSTVENVNGLRCGLLSLEGWDWTERGQKENCKCQLGKHGRGQFLRYP